MSESFIVMPATPASTGSAVRTIQRIVNGEVVQIETFSMVDSGSGATLTPARTEQFPASLTTAGNLKVALLEGMSGSTSVGITGSVLLTSGVTGSAKWGQTTGSADYNFASMGMVYSGSVPYYANMHIESDGDQIIHIKNVAETKINPATEDTLEVISGSLAGTLKASIVSGMSGSASVGITGSVSLPIITGSSPLQVWANQTGSWSITGGSGYAGVLVSGSVGITGSSTLTVQQTTGSSPVTIPVSAVQSGSWSITGGSGYPGVLVSGSVGITGSSTLNVAVLSGMSGSASVGITGSSTLNVAVVSGMSGSASVGITGSSTLNVVATTGSAFNVATVTTVSNLTGGSVGITGSATLNVTATTGSNFNIGNFPTIYSGIVSGSIGITGSATIPTVTTVSNLSGGSVGITGSSTLNVTATTGSNFNIGNFPTIYSGIVSGSIGITGSATIPTVTTVSNLSGGSVGITGSSTLTVNATCTTGSNFNIANFPTIYSGIVSGSVGITGSATIATITTVSNLSGGSVGITGSSSLNVVATTGSNFNVGNFPTIYSGIVSGSVGLTGSSTLSAQLQISGSTIAIGMTGSVGVSGSVTIVSTGSFLIAPNAAGVLVFASGSGQKVKVYDAGYTANTSCQHCFYFGNSTTLTTNQFLTSSGSGVYHQTFFQPRISAASQGLYLYSSGSDSNMTVDVGYVLET